MLQVHVKMRAQSDDEEDFDNSPPPLIRWRGIVVLDLLKRRDYESGIKVYRP